MEKTAVFGSLRKDSFFMTLRRPMIHQYKLGGYNIVLDVCSGALHVVDDLSDDIIAGLD